MILIAVTIGFIFGVIPASIAIFYLWRENQALLSRLLVQNRIKPLEQNFESRKEKREVEPFGFQSKVIGDSTNPLDALMKKAIDDDTKENGNR